MARDDVMMNDARREEFLGLTADAMRHLAKQDTFENASLFGWDKESRLGGWNNDTLVAAFERIIRQYVHEQWRMEYEPYTEPGRGIVPPITETLHQLGLLDSSEQEGGGDGA